jgi:hypothetical protein
MMARRAVTCQVSIARAMGRRTTAGRPVPADPLVATGSRGLSLRPSGRGVALSFAPGAARGLLVLHTGIRPRPALIRSDPCLTEFTGLRS